MHSRLLPAIDVLLTRCPVALMSGSQAGHQSGPMADFLAVVSVVAFIALFLGYIWCLERV
jgi:hypothetical protein